MLSKTFLKNFKKAKPKTSKKPLEKAVFLLLDTIETFRAIVLALFVAKKIPSCYNRIAYKRLNKRGGFSLYQDKLISLMSRKIIS